MDDRASDIGAFSVVFTIEVEDIPKMHSNVEQITFFKSRFHARLVAWVLTFGQFGADGVSKPELTTAGAFGEI
ncbi:MAG TPA: hypothetical protein VKW06_01995 [Candidatus Angelobacter sp.]|nr:hypothetical protein [Candidatus Angelobacter sp.]